MISRDVGPSGKPDSVSWFPSYDRFEIYDVTPKKKATLFSSSSTRPWRSRGEGGGEDSFKARGGLRTQIILDDGGTLGACRQITYLVRTPAPRGGS